MVGWLPEARHGDISYGGAKPQGGGIVKRVIFSSILVALLSAGACAHEGMIALYSEMDHVACASPLPKCQIIPLYLFYDRGEGPRVANAFSFRIAKSSADILFMEPQWAGENFFQYGSLSSGVSVLIHAGEADGCAEDRQTIYMARLDVLNVADQDTFTMSVLDNPNEMTPGIYALRCLPSYPYYPALGGTFVFNGRCHSPEDPFADGVAVATTTWGAMKSLFR